MVANETVPAFESFGSTVVEYDDAPDECTIYPTDVDENRQQTTWISAQEGSFCSIRSKV